MGRWLRGKMCAVQTWIKFRKKKKAGHGIAVILALGRVETGGIPGRAG